MFSSSVPRIHFHFKPPKTQTLLSSSSINPRRRRPQSQTLSFPSLVKFTLLALTATTLSLSPKPSFSLPKPQVLEQTQLQKDGKVQILEETQNQKDEKDEILEETQQRKDEKDEVLEAQSQKGEVLKKTQQRKDEKDEILKETQQRKGGKDQILETQNQKGGILEEQKKGQVLKNQQKDEISEQKKLILEENLALNPDDALSLQALMELKIQSGNLPDAIAIADRLIALDPVDNELPLLKGHLLNFAGEFDAARAEFEKIIVEDGLSVEAYHGLVMLAAQEAENGGEFYLDKVMERVELAIERCEEEGRVEGRDFRFLIAQIKVMVGQFEEALTVYKRLEMEDPVDFRTYLCQGVVYGIMEKKAEAEAEEMFEKYRKLAPEEHPYAEYVEENVPGMMAFGSKKDKGREGVFKK